MSDPRKPVAPLPPRWKPNPDPASIVVPGLDTDATVTEQIEQIEQLITIKLQNIDENFSKIHNVLANQILPSVKRYSIGTLPVREAAKFWTSFYEQAAQIRIPTFDEHSTVNDLESTELPEEDRTAEAHDPEQEDEDEHDSIMESSVATTDASFTPSQAVTSTPARGGPMDSFLSTGPGEPSWSTSMQSPLVRLKSELENFTTEDDGQFTPAAPRGAYEEPPTPERTDVTILPPSTKGKGKGKEPMLRNVLRHNLYSNQAADEYNSNVPVSPMRAKPKAKTPLVPKTYNPYLPPNTAPSEWSGIVDLSDGSALTPQQYRPATKPTSSHKSKNPYLDDSDEDSFDELMGMSPPKLMSPARPPRSSAQLGLLKVGQSPMKQAAARIKQDVLRDVTQSSHMYGVESSMSTVSTPPSLSKYHREDTSESLADATLESMMRRVGLEPPGGSTPGLRLRPKAPTSQRLADDSAEDSLPDIDTNLFAPNYVGNYNEQDINSDSDSSLEMEHNTQHPSAAFLMASLGRPGDDDDDSFGSSNQSGDSLDNGDMGMGGLVHPFAGSIEDDGFDDSFDDQEVQEETVFGVPPAQRNRLAAERAGH